MDVAKAGQILALMLSPTVAIWAALNAPRAVRAVRRRVTKPDPEAALLASHPPIEQLAIDLRRLLQRHEVLRQSGDVAMRVHRLRGLEAAISDCATDAARALGLPCPERPPHSALTTPELRRLLRSLADAGLVLPPSVGLLAADGHG
jgi:hypothetical protein